MNLQHWMSFSTFKEQNYFIFPNSNSYFGVVFNGNMVAHAPAGLAAFLIEKTRVGFNYIIDPVTHAFQHDTKFIKNSNNELKSSIKNLANSYGDVINRLAGVRPITPGDLSEDEHKIDFVNNCLDFQRGIITKAIEENDSTKYFEEDMESNMPYAIVSPYFYLDDTNLDNWLPINYQLANLTIESKLEGEKVFVPIVLDPEILADSDTIDKVVEVYDDLENDGFLFWLSNFDETSVGRQDLQNMIEFCRKLRKHSTKELINLHGGYFSLLASSEVFGHPAFSGVTHGPEFGEYRDVVPVGGGIPISKYYIHHLHTRIRYRDAAQYFKTLGWLENSEEFHSNVCNCPECMRIINNNADNFTKYGETDDKVVMRNSIPVTLQYPTKETKVSCLKHYLYRKSFEYDYINNLTSKEEAISDLKIGYDTFKDFAPSSVKHLARWKKALVG